MTRLRRAVGTAFILGICLVASGCFTIEQEVFLNADGSGDLVLHLSVPDLPEDLTKQASGMGVNKDSGLNIDELTKDISAAKNPKVKIKEVKTVRQNGVQGVYVIFQFADLNDMNAALAEIGKSGSKDAELLDRPDWKINLSRSSAGSVYTSSFFLDLSNDKKTKGKGTPKMTDQDAPKGDEPFDKLGEQLTALISGTIRMRFVLHAPSQITSSNADIILNGRTAVWNCSPTAFLKDKKPVQMKAVF
ncbi:MAG TPA: hypothetical protein VFV34_07945 [Blastocatellia bacterium]|nr:hypothetical protein [Blastocatellia bacterium]